MWFVAKNEEEDYYIDLTRKYLSTYPLIFACSVVNLNGHSAFKQEFVIPQMLMQWVYRNYATSYQYHSKHPFKWAIDIGKI